MFACGAMCGAMRGCSCTSTGITGCSLPVAKEWLTILRNWAVVIQSLFPMASACRFLQPRMLSSSCGGSWASAIVCWSLVTATNFYLKGVMTVLRALSLLDAPARKKLVVVITGHNQDAVFEQFIRRHDLHNGCRLAGWVKNIDDYYHAADIFLHPTYHDAGSLSTLKSLAAGCAVVTSRFDGSADLIRNGVTGLVLDRPDDAGKLAETLRQLLDSDLRKRLRAAARQLAPSIGQEHQFQQLEALYPGILSRKTRPV